LRDGRLRDRLLRALDGPRPWGPLHLPRVELLLWRALLRELLGG